MKTRFFPLALLFALALACNYEAEPFAPSRPEIPTPAPLWPSPTREPTAGLPPATGKWSLWLDGPHLRGANIYQRRV